MDLQLDLFSWIMEGYFDYNSAEDFFAAKAEKNVNLMYSYALSVKLDSSKFRRIYFPESDVPDLTGQFSQELPNR